MVQTCFVQILFPSLLNKLQSGYHSYQSTGTTLNQGEQLPILLNPKASSPVSLYFISAQHLICWNTCLYVACRTSHPPYTHWTALATLSQSSLLFPSYHPSLLTSELSPWTSLTTFISFMILSHPSQQFKCELQWMLGILQINFAPDAVLCPLLLLLKILLK